MPDFVRRAKQRRLIHQIGGDEGRRNRRPALHHQPGDAAVGERLQHGRQIETAVLRLDAKHLDALGLQNVLGDRRRARSREHPDRHLARGADDRGRQRNAKPGVENDPHRRAREHARQPAGQVRVVGEHRADADQNGVSLRAHLVHPLPRRLPGDADRLAAGEARLAVGGDGKLQQHLRPGLAHPPRMAGVVAHGVFRAEPGFDHDPAFAKPGVALPRHLRIDILQRRHHAGDAGLDDGVGARRRLAVMRARLERHVERCALRGLAGALQRLGLGVRPPARLGPAATDDDAVLDDHRADRRIGPGPAEPAAAECQRKLHETPIVPGIVLGRRRRGSSRCLRRVRHLRAATGGLVGSSSPLSSSSACWKSLGSRKLR